jgi:hypothetical protein
MNAEGSCQLVNRLALRVRMEQAVDLCLVQMALQLA